MTMTFWFSRVCVTASCTNPPLETGTQFTTIFEYIMSPTNSPDSNKVANRDGASGEPDNKRSRSDSHSCGYEDHHVSMMILMWFI